MPNSHTITPILPIIAAAKTTPTSPELRSGNSFNQVLKNEYANKAKKSGNESPKSPTPAQTKVNASTSPTTNKISTETSNSDNRDSIQQDDQEKDETVSVNLADPATLLSLVNRLTIVARNDASPIDENSGKEPDLIASDSLVGDASMGLPVTSTDDNVTTTANADVQDSEMTFSSFMEKLPKNIDPAGYRNQIDTSKSELTETNPSSEKSTLTSLVAQDLLSSPAPMTSELKSLLSNQSLTNQATVDIDERVAPDDIELPLKLSPQTDNTLTDTENVRIEPSQNKGVDITPQDSFRNQLNAKFEQEHLAEANTQRINSNETFNVSTQNRAEAMVPAPSLQSNIETLSSLPSTEHIGPRVGSKAWDQAIGQKIVWMVAGGEQSAQLSLNPPDLGPLQVVLSISDNFVDASFVSSHLDVREAIESAVPKLREMMDNAGISLSGFSVSAESPQSGQGFQSDSSQRTQFQSSQRADNASEIEMPITTPARATGRELGLVDTFV
ncbi:flagellar hook-length control protein FliK [Undibacterium fentianense]|uniref:Flagellar hook-length control protein FliK n=1 Tax=Undibacterium fentianense TaxID=2828728 RepID=A0A941IFD9_9BURK|nr:flagellar hook-length control protein FliK [Undibacterium fentianense]MBR7798945.1 flagellar hook-length control protein FliK [Undibacterium fentianense]